jgi:DNA-binding MarR family transcriptional regulator
MRPQSMGPVIASLEAMGLITGAPDPNDGRQTILALTEQCRQWIAKGRAARQDWLSRRIEQLLSPQERSELARAVTLLTRLVDE